MKSLAKTTIAATAIAAVPFASLAVGTGRAQTTKADPNGSVVTRYTDWQFQPLQERIKKRGLLEEISEFLSPLKLKKKLIFETVSCGTVNAFYDPKEQTVHLC